MYKRTATTGKVQLLLLVFLLARTGHALDRQQELRHYGHQSWQTDNGLPQNTVRAVLQTRDGYLWLATDGGLVRFDGVQFVVYDKQSGAKLPTNSINSLYEDRSGALWISTSDGLIRRRGAEFTTFTTADGLPGNNVSSVYEDRTGILWALTAQGLAGFANRRFTPLPLEAKLSSSGSIVEAPDGSLWIGTNEGVVHLKEGSVAPQPAGLVHLETQALAAGADGRVWVGTRTGVELVTGSAVAILDKQHGLPANEVTALLAEAGGRIWIGTSNGLVSVEKGQFTKYGLKEGLPGERIQGLYQDREGAVWVSTNHGVARIVNGQLQTFGPHEGLSGNVVLSMFEDREGSLWMGTQSGGLTVLHDHKFTTYTTANGLSEDLVRAVYQDHAGVLWIGTNGGGLDRLDKTKTPATFVNLSTASGLSSNIVLALADDAQGNLWVGTPDGLNRIHSGRVTVYTSADGLADDFVRSLSAAPDGSLWIGTRRGLSHLQDGHFTSYSSMDGLGSNLVGALLEDRHADLAVAPPPLSAAKPPAAPAASPSGRVGPTSISPKPPGSKGAAPPAAPLWIGTLGGLSHLQNGKFITLTTHDGLSSNIVTALDEDADGTLWIGTSGGALDRLDKGAITAFPASGLPENIYAILEDRQGNLWLSSDKGVYRIAIRDLDRFAKGSLSRLMPEVYGTADGMAISECSSGGHPAAWRLRNGTLAFATLKGVAEVDPAHAPSNLLPPPVMIGQVTFDDRVIELQTITDKTNRAAGTPDQSPDQSTGNQSTADQGNRSAGDADQAKEHNQDGASAGPLVLPPGQGRLVFEYTAMSFIAPQKVRFRYKLEGFDHDWVDAGTRRTAYYTNIPPGRYTFRVLACNNDGVWNETGAALSLRLRPHFYQTWIFDVLALLVAALLAAALAYAVYRRRVKRVESQFGAVLAERGRIAREIHDTLAQSLVAISVQLEIVSRLLSSSSDSAREHLDKARNMTRRSLTEARASIWDLRSEGAGGVNNPGGTVSAVDTPAGDDPSAVVETENLGARLLSMAARVTAGSSIKIQSKVGGADHPLPAKLEEELLRIAQEAVTNAVRHSGAEHVRLGVVFETRLLTMVIEDDGCGFSGQPHPTSDGPEGHFGLRGMRERAAEIGGTFLVESAPGDGTLIRVQVPIK